MAVLKLININKIYDNNVQAVFDFNLEIKDKEFIVLVGPSGCGKSTTLRMIAGLEDISSGQLYLDGELINDIPSKDRNMAMVFQSYALYPQYTVYDNMAFSLKLRKSYKPIYKKNPEIDKIEEENRTLRAEAHQYDKLFMREQNSSELLDKRNEVYEKIFANNEKIESLQEPVVGIDLKLIDSYQKQVKKLNKQISKNKKDLAKYYIEDSPYRNSLLSLIKEKEEKIKFLNNRIEFLKNNEVPLVKYRKLTREEIDNEVNKTAKTIDLTRYLFRKPSALSGGQRQRVALGRAIVRKPKVFLMDEPLSNLDAKLRVQTREEIIKIHERVGATTIYVTHDQTEAMTMASRIVIMKDGYVQQIGTPTEVYDDPNNVFVGSFIGSPSMNFLNVKFDGENVCFEDGSKIKLNQENIKLLKNKNTDEFILGIRPEAISIANEDDDDSIPVYCDFSELLGDQILSHLKLSNSQVVMKSDAVIGLINNKNIKIKFDSKKLYFFDRENEKRIR